MNEFISRSKALVSEIIREIERPDRNPVRLRELREELKLVAQSDTNERKPMKGIRVSYLEAFCVLVVFAIMIGVISRLCIDLHTSRANEREMSKMYSDLVRKAYK